MRTRVYNPVLISLLIHFGFAVFLIMILWRPIVQNGVKKIDFEVIEFPKQVPIKTQLRLQTPAKAQIAPRNEVFGISRKAITSPINLSGVGVKQGNTVAKVPDNRILKDSDPDSLPILTDDYLVSSMPSLVKEFRIPYPEEARTANVEGPVVMDLIIDATGRVRKVEILKGPGFGLNEAAEKAIYNFEFKPARAADQNVAVKIRYTYRFVLESR